MYRISVHVFYKFWMLSFMLYQYLNKQYLWKKNWILIAEIRTVWLCTTVLVYTTPLESLANPNELEETSLPHLQCSDMWPQLCWRLFWKVTEAMPIQIIGTISYILIFLKSVSKWLYIHVLFFNNDIWLLSKTRPPVKRAILLCT